MSEINIKELIKVLSDIDDEKSDFDELDNQFNSDESNEKQIKITNVANLNSIYNIQRNIYPQLQYKSNFLTLNTKYRVLDNDNTTLKWNYLNNAQYQQGTVNTYGKLHHIIGLRLYQVHMLQNYYTLGATNLAFSLLIKEFVSQSFIAHEGTNFHFMLRLTQPYDTLDGASLNPSDVLLTPMNDGYFWFRKPFTEISKFTIQFFNPIVPIASPVYSVERSVIWMTYGAVTTLIMGAGTLFSTGNIVVIQNFTTTDPIADAAVIDAINDPDGHSITITSIPTSTFTIPVNSTGIAAVDPRIVLTVTNESTGVIISMEVIYIESESSEIDI